MDGNEWVSLITSIAACLTAAATFRVARQMSMQRSESYKPQLVVTRTQFEAQSHEGGLTYKWEKSGIKDQNYQKSSSVTEISATVVNVGFGAAKDVTARWVFPVGKLVSTINRAAQESLTPIYFKWNEIALSIKSETSGNSTHFWGPYKQQYFDFVLPARDTSQNTIELVIPHLYMQLISSLIHLAVRTDDVNKYLNDIPPLRCEMECSDIGGARHSINIDLRLTLFIINGEDDERKISFSGSIDASRKIY